MNKDILLNFITEGIKRVMDKCNNNPEQFPGEYHVTNITYQDGELYIAITIPQPIKYINYNLCVNKKGWKEEEDHTGMVYNPYSDKWSYL